jgi:hypothetical protein
MVFDVFYHDQRDLTRPLRDCRQARGHRGGAELVFLVRRLAADRLEAWQQLVQRGYPLEPVQACPGCRAHVRGGAPRDR